MMESWTAPSATVSIGSGSGLTRALYVRDRFALPSIHDVPALDPPVPAHAVEGVPGDAWDQWWQTLLGCDPSGPTVPPSDERLAELAAAVDDEARWWEDVNVTWDPLYDSSWVSSWLIDHALRVPVEVVVVGAGGVWHAQVGPARHLVSVGFYRAHDRMDALLHEALEAQV